MLRAQNLDGLHMGGVPAEGPQLSLEHDPSCAVGLQSLQVAVQQCTLLVCRQMLQIVYHCHCKLFRTYKGNVRSIPPAFPRKFLRVKVVRTPRLLREMHRPLTVAGLRWFSGTVCRRNSRKRAVGSKGCYLF